MVVHPPQPMACPSCRVGPVSPHPQSTAVIGMYECEACHQEWSARFHDDEVTVTMTSSSNEPQTMTTSLKDLNTGMMERLR